MYEEQLNKWDLDYLVEPFNKKYLEYKDRNLYKITKKGLEFKINGNDKK